MNASRMMMLSLVIAGAVTATAKAEEFTIVALPDTQNYSGQLHGGTAAMFTAQTNWIQANAAAKNIKYVAHLGDVVEHQANLTEWVNAKSSMALLENSGIAFGTCMGNHDSHYGNGSTDTTSKDHAGTNYVANFGPNASYGSTGQTYAQQSWYGGASASGRSNYQIVSAGGYQFLYLNVSIDCPQEELDWAQGVLNANKDKPTVFSTHRGIYDFKLAAGYYGDAVTGKPLYDHAGMANESYYLEADGTSKTSWPVDIEQSFVRANKQIFMTLYGHCHAQYQQQVTNQYGLPVIEVLTDYQDGPLGGAGWMRSMKVDTVTGKVSFETFSPVMGRDRAITDDFAESIMLVSMYKETLSPLMMPGVDPSTPQGKAAVATLVQGLQKNLDGQTNSQIASLLAGLQMLDTLPADLRDDQAIYPVWQAYDEVRTYVKTYLGESAWDTTGDWDGLWYQVFASGQRNPSFSYTVDFASYIPEPASLSLLVLGGLMIAGRRRPF